VCERRRKEIEREREKEKGSVGDHSPQPTDPTYVKYLKLFYSSLALI